MEQPLTPPPDIALDPDGRIDQNLTCIKCGYNLRGLSPDGACPECASAVGRSIQGDQLKFSPPDWVETLAGGTNWVIAGIIIAILSSCLSRLALSFVRDSNLLTMIVQGLDLVGIVGFWLTTTPDPARAHDEPALSARRLARGTLLLRYLLEWGAILPIRLQQLLVMPIGLASTVLGVVWMIAICTYARKLALRIPSAKLAREVRLLMWGWLGMAIVRSSLIVIVIAWARFQVVSRTGWFGFAGCGVGVGLLGLGLLSLAVVLSFRRHLLAAAWQARHTWASQPAPGVGPLD